MTLGRPRYGEAVALVREYAEASAMTVDELCGPSRCRWLVAKRRELARGMRDRGLSYPVIGLAMRRDHGTIQTLLKGKGRHSEPWVDRWRRRRAAARSEAT